MRDPASPFFHREFRLWAAARVLGSVALQIQSVAIGWQVYAITGRPLDLAFVGLAQFLPAFLLSLPGGHLADRVERRRILAGCYAALVALALGLAAATRLHAGQLAAIYTLLAGVGAVRAFVAPAGQSILPGLVPPAAFARAVAWQSTLWQGAIIAGPMLGGVLYAAFGGAAGVYTVAAACATAALVLVASMRRIATAPPQPATLESLLAGVRFVWRSPLVLGSISLDLFAVLLGGATALLPVFARDVLHLGPWALGALRAAPGVGATGVGVFLSFRPLRRRAGARMLACVAIFGVATVVFGLSRSFWLSLVALSVAGAADMVSVVVRSSLVQLATPDPMRGRVSAVNSVFIGASNELGELESGLTAQLWGAVPAVVAGGLGTLLVVAVWAVRFPALRGVDRLDASLSTSPASSAPPA
jgi:MFS family permease